MQPSAGRGCAGKEKFATRQAAKAMLVHLKIHVIKKDRDMEPYHCQFCGAWHFGHYHGRPTRMRRR